MWEPNKTYRALIAGAEALNKDFQISRTDNYKMELIGKTGII